MSTESLARAQQIASGVLAAVGPDQLDAATPCAEWDVSALIDHLVGAQHWARSAVEGVEMSETGEGSSGGDFGAAFDAAATRCLAAFEEPGALDRTVDVGMGEMPAGALLGLAVTDTFVHAWDLARATGQATDLDPELAGQILTTSRAHIEPAFRSEDGKVFGLEQPAPSDADTATRLAAFLGRRV
ncbi:MAG: TIGR03086 family metal-binding protein [Microthrixaceae bacterium]